MRLRSQNALIDRNSSTFIHIIFFYFINSRRCCHSDFTYYSSYQSALEVVAAIPGRTLIHLTGLRSIYLCKGSIYHIVGHTTLIRFLLFSHCEKLFFTLNRLVDLLLIVEATRQAASYKLADKCSLGHFPGT